MGLFGGRVIPFIQIHLFIKCFVSVSLVLVSSTSVKAFDVENAQLKIRTRGNIARNEFNYTTSVRMTECTRYINQTTAEIQVLERI